MEANSKKKLENNKSPTQIKNTKAILTTKNKTSVNHNSAMIDKDLVKSEKAIKDLLNDYSNL